MSVHASITSDVIEPAAVLSRVGADADGAAVLFLGTVRNENENRPVSGMRYDAFVEMAVPVLRAIAEEAAAQCGSDRIAVVHRVGELGIGEVSVAIAVSTPHRAEAFDAARYIIEQIKQRLPVWKHEHYVGGAAQWLSGAIPPGTA
jgi:molybdopterin synthase catalytic subunit